ncbi:MAG: hypothetical protein JNM25_09705 [Planctomycetes bacterium]|nr:hypothetical protein [Planctomycetota bacterium]
MPNRFAVLSAWLLLSLAGANAQDAPLRRGYAHPTFDFAGTFADVISTVLLQREGDRVIGTFDRGAWQLDGTVEDRIVRGTAKSPTAEQPFTARFVDDELRLRIGESESGFRRVLATDPRLADLGDPVVDPERRWTIAVYLGGDNNLENGAIDDLGELQRGLPDKGVDVVVLFDRREHPGNQEEGVWSETRVFHLQQQPKGDLELLVDAGERDTGDGRTLASFLTGAFRKYPAEHTAVVIWNHGGGWTGIVQDEKVPGQDGPDMMGLVEVQLALRTAQLRAPILEPIDLVVYDACLMAHLETAIATMDAARWMVASQASVPGEGCPYEQVLPLFAAHDDAGEIAKGIVAAFGTDYEGRHDSSVTYAAVDLAQIPRVAQLLDRFADELLPAIDDATWPAIARALFYAESYQPRSKRTTEKWRASLDLQDVLARLRTAVQPMPEAAARTLGELETALAAAVTASHHGEQRTQSHGLSVFAPYRMNKRLEAYGQTSLGAGNHWTHLLLKLHILGTGDVSPVAFADVVVHGEARDGRQVVQPFHGDSVSFTLEGRGLVHVEQWDCVRDGEGYVVLRKNLVVDRMWPRRLELAVADEADRLLPRFVDGRNELGSELFGMQFLVDNRGDTLRPATIDMSAPSSQAPFVLRAQLTQPGEPALDVEVHFDRAWWRVVGIYPLGADEDEFEQRSITATAESEFRFVLETIGDDGASGQVLGEPIKWQQGLWLVLSRDEPGQYRSSLRAYTLDGRTAEAHADYELVASPDLEQWIASWQTFDRDLLTDRWSQFEVTGPGQQRETGAVAHFVRPSPLGPGVFDVETKLGADGADGTTHQTWVFEQRGIPNLRIITEIASHTRDDARTFCWYGPAMWGLTAQKAPTIAMKAINVSGVLWRWEKSLVDMMRLRPQDK